MAFSVSHFRLTIKLPRYVQLEVRPSDVSNDCCILLEIGAGGKNGLPRIPFFCSPRLKFRGRHDFANQVSPSSSPRLKSKKQPWSSRGKTKFPMVEGPPFSLFQGL
jgi:hypothetical protein